MKTLLVFVDILQEETFAASFALLLTRLRCKLLPSVGPSNLIRRIQPYREYELIKETHAQVSVVRNCSRSFLRVCLGEGKQLSWRAWGGQQ
jgi:hypothetical protein